MLRNLTMAALMGMVVCAMTSTSEAAGANNRSFKVEASEGTDAGIAFGPKFLTLGNVLVHTPEGDFNGRYSELGPIVQGPSLIAAFANDNGFTGVFFAIAVDNTPNTPATATISGFVIGTTGVATFVGQAKN